MGSARYIRLDGNGTGASGTSSGFDLDAIGIVTAASFDCDADGIPETCEMALGTVADCDSSGTADSCDTLGGANDCNGDSVPDACEPDCNANVTPDACDLIAMTSADCNGNAVPDECDLLANTVTLSGSMAPVGSGATPTFTLLSPFPAASDVTVTVSAASDLGATNEYLDFTVNAVPLTRLFETTGQQCTETQEIGVAGADAFNLATGGISATAGLLAPSAVDAFECSASHATVTLSYTPIVDCNGNGALDYCDIAGALSTDANLNGIADDCDTFGPGLVAGRDGGIAASGTGCP